MALDKQMILNELGSVMNKLQSADCGCMGKLFTQGQHANQGQGGAAMGHPLPTCGGCRRGCCHGHGYSGHNHGYSAPCAGEPHSANNSRMGMQCNPHRLYADTYNYLSSNYMKPVVQEVYQDLKSINPANSVVNNPMASQMGLQQQGGGTAMQGNMGMTQNQMPGSNMGTMQDPNMYQHMGNQQMDGQHMVNQHMGYEQMGHQQMGNQQMGSQQMGNQQVEQQQMGNQQMENQQMGQMMGGMGPNIVNMMQGDSKSPFGQMTGAMTTPSTQGQAPGTMSHEQYNSGMTNNASSYGGQQTQSQYMQQQNMSNAINPNSHNTLSMQQNAGQPGATYKVNYSNPAAQQMSTNRGNQSYGQHTPGIAKFNEMFPGVMGGMGGDLGFDPMAIAIQMNPANQQQAAMGQMEKLMSNNPVERILDPSSKTNSLQPAITGANAAAAATALAQNISPSNQQLIPVQPGATQQNQGYTNMAANQPNQAPQQAYGQVPQKQQQQVYTASTINQNQIPQYQQQTPQQYQQQPSQQHQQQPPQQYQQQQNVDQNAQQYQQQQQYVDPNAQATLPNPYNGTNADTTYHQLPQSYNAPPTSAPDQQVKEPIFPAETRTMKYNTQYNTLGQPVEMLPAKMYHPAPDTNTQQTLSPQPIAKMRNDQPKTYVKNTVSKTSLMGNRPVGRTPSRSQLQQIYNQYKGSQSYTQQNIRPLPAQGTTFSDRKINVALASANHHRHVPVERVGGDTMVNNQMESQVPVKGQPMGTGDVPMPVDNKPHGDIIPTKEPVIKKCRNGLQDVVFSSYATSAAWSFHGNNERTPYSPGYRLRGRS